MPITRAAKIKRQAHETDIRVGANIRRFRKLAGMSQTQLAQCLGLTFQQIQKYEKASNRVSAGRLVQIAEALDRNVTAFFRPVPVEDARKAA